MQGPIGTPGRCGGAVCALDEGPGGRLAQGNGENTPVIQHLACAQHSCNLQLQTQQLRCLLIPGNPQGCGIIFLGPLATKLCLAAHSHKDALCGVQAVIIAVHTLLQKEARSHQYFSVSNTAHDHGEGQEEVS